MRVTLSKGDMVLELDPCAGGAVSALRHRDLHVLRPAPARIGPAFDPLKYAAFAMVPFVGRIHNGQFDCDGNSIALHPNLPPEPHAIHGHGWRAPWKLESEANGTATLVYNHTADAWPWDYAARQTFTLGEAQLNINLSVTNHGDTKMPAGLGWHPYFFRENATLSLPTTHQWRPDEQTGKNIPSAVNTCTDLSAGQPVETLSLDTTFSISEPLVSVTWPTHSVSIICDPIFTHATIYVPPGEDYFCAEPCTQAPNAVNSALSPQMTGMKWLAPGETLAGSIQLSVSR